MESSHRQTINSEVSFQNRPHSKVKIPPNICFSGPYQIQNWDLPNSVIFYMAKNPLSPEVYQKLIQSCKYFFSKNSLIVIKELYYDNDGWKIGFNKRKINIELQKIPFKMWIDKIFEYAPYILIERNSCCYLLSSIIPSFYRWDVINLTITWQVISFEEFVMLASNAKKISLEDVAVQNPDGTVVMFEELFKALTKVKHLHYYNFYPKPMATIAANTFEKLLDTPHFKTLDYLSLKSVPEDFGLDNFYIYMKENKHTRIHLNFSDLISYSCERRIEKIIDEIIATENHNYKVPFLFFGGLKYEKYNKLFKICYPI